MPNAIRFKFSNVAQQQGELARLKVLQGPDLGAIYVLTSSEATVGRGEDNDVVISDLKASRSHAVLSQSASGWTVKDRGSANGILYNGSPSREANLRIHDTFTLGGTTIEFLSPDHGIGQGGGQSTGLDQIAGQAPIHQGAFPSQSLPGMSTAFGSVPAPGSDEGRKSLLKNPLVLAGLGGAALLLVFGDDGNKAKLQKPTQSAVEIGAKKENDKEDKKDLAAYLPLSDAEKPAEGIFKDGMREYYLRNYSRARTQFETVLQINPAHVLAGIYLENCNNAIEEEVKSNLANGKKSFQAGKIREAKGNFERVMRLLFRDQTNPAFIEAKDQLEKINIQINERGR